jgi:hypothetical protein
MLTGSALRLVILRGLGGGEEGDMPRLVVVKTFPYVKDCIRQFAQLSAPKSTFVLTTMTSMTSLISTTTGEIYTFSLSEFLAGVTPSLKLPANHPFRALWLD